MNKTYAENEKRRKEDWGKKGDTRKERIERYEQKVDD